MPRYELKDESSNKFWEITLEGDSFTTRYGKIGAAGQKTTKSFDSPEKAKKEYDKIIAEKVKKGYALVKGAEGAVASKPAGDDAPSNPELEAAIAEDPERPDPYLVYADWLQAKGDPRGELITIEHALLSKPEFRRWQELTRQEEALIEKNRDALMGETLSKNAERLKLTWHLGFIRSARVAVDYESHEAGVRVPALIEALLDHPSGRFLQELVVGLESTDGENGYQEVIDLLVSRKPRTLRKLFLGDFDYPEETEMSWSHLGNASKLWPALPRLKSVILQSGTMTLGNIELPDCREFEVRTGGLSGESVRAITGAKWPRLERLEVWFGSRNYGAEGTIDAIRPILDAKGLPALKHLALKNSEFTDEICAAIPKSKVLKQLETLDLSMGCMTHEGAQHLAAGKESLAHLKTLNLENNALTDEALALVEGIVKDVRTGEQSPDRGGPPDERYASVGE